MTKTMTQYKKTRITFSSIELEMMQSALTYYQRNFLIPQARYNSGEWKSAYERSLGRCMVIKNRVEKSKEKLLQI